MSKKAHVREATSASGDGNASSDDPSPRQSLEQTEHSQKDPGSASSSSSDSGLATLDKAVKLGTQSISKFFKGWVPGTSKSKKRKPQPFPAVEDATAGSTRQSEPQRGMHDDHSEDVVLSSAPVDITTGASLLSDESQQPNHDEE